MNQAALTQIVSKLRIKILPRARIFANIEGQAGRIKNMRMTVEALLRHERIELNFYRADEARGYAERLIADALRYGECHRPTMEMANFWLQDKALVPKLFKVLVPRFMDLPSNLPYTRLLKAPYISPDEHKKFEWPAKRIRRYDRAILELRGNPYPPLPGPMNKTNPSSIVNVLLEEARRDIYSSRKTSLSSSTVEPPEMDAEISHSEPQEEISTDSQIESEEVKEEKKS